MNILVLDNYDSFTYNLVQYLMEITGQEIDVFRNDEIELADVDQYDVIVLSPGPGVPKDAGIMPELIKQYADRKSIFGVCLGVQAIGEAFGAELHNLTRVFHGIATPITILDKEDALFSEIPDQFMAGRYHSWVVNKKDLPESLIITAEDEQGGIMALRHETLHVKGVQFHPESIMTEHGHQLLKNFLEEARQRQLQTSI